MSKNKKKQIHAASQGLREGTVGGPLSSMRTGHHPSDLHDGGQQIRPVQAERKIRQRSGNNRSNFWPSQEMRARLFIIAKDQRVWGHRLFDRPKLVLACLSSNLQVGTFPERKAWR